MFRIVLAALHYGFGQALEIEHRRAAAERAAKRKVDWSVEILLLGTVAI